MTAISRDHLGWDQSGLSMRYNEKDFEVNAVEVGADYLATTGLTLLEGRDFKENSETDATESIIVNEQFLKNYGMKNPIGEKVIIQDSLTYYIIV